MLECPLNDIWITKLCNCIQLDDGTGHIIKCQNNDFMVG